MLFIDKNDLRPKPNDDNPRKDRKVICELCSVMQDKLYIHTVTMNFNPKANVYICPNYERCKNKVSGKVIENIIYFNNKDFIYEPKKEEGKVVRMAGLGDDDKIPPVEIVNLESTNDHQYQEPE